MSLPGTHQDVDFALAGERRWGPGAVRPATGDDAIDGVTPRFVLEPGNAEMLSAMLRWASADGLALVVRGAGTKQTWASVAPRVDALLSTARMNTAFEHCAGDLTAMIAAGMPLAEANAILRRSRQWLPFDPPHAASATIGGLVATNDSGPRRHGFGTPRDLVIGVEIALADGRLARGGGRVVKNVAGYDLARLMCGSFGTLGVIVSATFKLSPMAEASRTVVADLREIRDVAAIAAAMSASQLVASAFEVEWPRLRVLIRFETIAVAAQQQAGAAALLCEPHAARVAILQDDDEEREWQQHMAPPAAQATAPATLPATTVRIGVLPADVAFALDAIGSVTSECDAQARVVGRIGIGALVLRLAGTLDARVAAIVELRRRLETKQGHVTVTAAERELRARLDPWGPIGPAFAVMRALKQQFDPTNTLNPGRGPGGL